MEGAGSAIMPERKYDPWPVPLLVAGIMVICSLAWSGGGVLQPELQVRLPYYLSSRPLLNKLFDSDTLDFGMYQARELSYFFDYIDCNFIAWCVRLGHPHFLSLTYYVFLTAMTCVLWRFGVVDLRLDWRVGLAVLLLFWTAPAVFLGGTFFRTSKIGVALALVVLYGMIYRVLSQPDSVASRRTALACFGWAWVATLFDRQGVYLVAVVLFFLGMRYMARHDKASRSLVVPFAAAFAVSILYNYLIAPVLSLYLNNLWPRFRYQHLPWLELLRNPGHYASSGFDLYMDAVRFFLGNGPVWATALAIGCLTSLARRKWFDVEAIGFFLSQTGLIWLMMALMVLRHGALLWPEVRPIYYFLPAIATFAMSLLFVLSKVELSRPILSMFLGAAIAGNLIALPGHSAAIRGGHSKVMYDEAPALFEALRNLDNPRYVVSQDLARNPVLIFFHGGPFRKDRISTGHKPNG